MTKDDLLPLIKKNPISVGCGVLAIALGGAIYYRSDELPAAEEALAQKSAEADRLAANVQNAAQLKEQVEALATANKEVEARLVHASQTLNTYQFFFKMESDTQVKMTAGPTQGLSAAPKGGPKTAFITVPFSVTLQGSLPHLLDYLRRLESGARYCRVVSVTCGVPVADRSAPVTLSLTLEMLGLP
jgi:hypothetical protein